MSRRRNARIHRAIDNVRALAERNPPARERHDAGREALAPIRDDHSLWVSCLSHVQEGAYPDAVWALQQAAERPPAWAFYGKLLLPLLALIPLLVLGWHMGAFSEPAQIENPDPKCVQGIHNALGAFQREMPFRFGEEQVDELASTGTIARTYRRDGVEITVTLRLVALDEGCRLRAVRKRRVEPGQMSTRSGNFGHVDIPACVCE